MDKFNERSSNSELYARINAMPLTASEREIALSGLRGGTIIADSILWLISGIKGLAVSAKLKQAASTKRDLKPATRWHRHLES